MKDYSLMSMVEIAIDIQSQPNTEKTTFLDLYNKVCEIKGFDEEERKAHIAQFYTDITASGDFLYCGEDLWDLKKNQKLEALDTEFYSEHVADESEEDEEVKPKRKPKRAKRQEELFSEEEDDDDNNVNDEEDESYENADYDAEEDEDDDRNYDNYEPDFDHDQDNDDYDDDESDREEEKYNDIMDEYEDLYDD